MINHQFIDEPFFFVNYLKNISHKFMVSTHRNEFINYIHKIDVLYLLHSQMKCLAWLHIIIPVYKFYE
jgi:hypothetical protein